MFGTVIVAFLSCGLVSGNSHSRIINGANTNTDKHPHQVSLEYQREPGAFGHVCGASIIAARWILTAAHCVEFAGYDVTQFRIAVNNGLLSDPNKEVFYIQKIIHHEAYNTGGLFGPAFINDIALIELTSDIPDSAEKVIPLYKATGELDRQNCTISGWGYDEEGTESRPLPDVLQETTGVIYTESQCQNAWNTIFQRPYSHSYHVCIHNLESGSCNGDSGGPMICNGKLAGVTSWGASGCNVQMPSVYVRVPNYIQWIEDNMNGPTPTFL